MSSALIRGYKLDTEAAGLSLILRLLPSKPYGKEALQPPPPLPGNLWIQLFSVSDEILGYGLDVTHKLNCSIC